MIIISEGAPGSPADSFIRARSHYISNQLKLETLGFCTDGADICEVKGNVRLVLQKPPAMIAHCMMGNPWKFCRLMDAIAGSHPNLNTFLEAADVPRENSPLSESAGRLISQTFTEWLQQGGNHGNGVVNTTMPQLYSDIAIRL